MKGLFIQGDNIVLRYPRMSDADDITRNVNDKDVTKWLLLVPYPYERDDAISFIGQCQKLRRSKKGYNFVIVYHNEVVGVVGLGSINHEHKNAEIGYWLGKRYWGKGIMTDAVGLIVRFGFKQLKLHRIHTTIFEKNNASARVLEKNGFTFEGTIKDRWKREGKWVSGRSYSIIDSKQLHRLFIFI